MGLVANTITFFPKPALRPSRPPPPAPPLTPRSPLFYRSAFTSVPRHLRHLPQRAVPQGPTPPFTSPRRPRSLLAPASSSVQPPVRRMAHAKRAPPGCRHVMPYCADFWPCRGCGCALRLFGPCQEHGCRLRQVSRWTSRAASTSGHPITRSIPVRGDHLLEHGAGRKWRAWAA